MEALVGYPSVQVMLQPSRPGGPLQWCVDYIEVLQKSYRSRAPHLVQRHRDQVIHA